MIVKTTIDQMIEIIKPNQIKVYEYLSGEKYRKTGQSRCSNCCENKSKYCYCPLKDVLINQITPILENNNLEYIKTCRIAFSNALKHGKFPIKVSLYLGDHGYIFQVKDSGSGFDAQKIMKLQKQRLKYFKYHGKGFRYYVRKDSKISFADHGKTINVMIT